MSTTCKGCYLYYTSGGAPRGNWLDLVLIPAARGTEREDLAADGLSVGALLRYVSATNGVPDKVATGGRSRGFGRRGVGGLHGSGEILKSITNHDKHHANERHYQDANDEIDDAAHGDRKGQALRPALNCCNKAL